MSLRGCGAAVCVVKPTPGLVLLQRLDVARAGNDELHRARVCGGARSYVSRGTFESLLRCSLSFQAQLCLNFLRGSQAARQAA